MQSQLTIPMPRRFPRLVHQALRTWHDPQAKGALSDLVLCEQVQASRKTSTARGTSNEILMQALEGLRPVDQQAHDLLQRRFPNNETARSVAFRFNVSEDVIFQRQRLAIEQLADIIWQREVAARREQLRRIEARLEPPTYTRLFGVAAALAGARSLLEAPSEPWILSLEGMGGIGKTALADALVRDLATGVRFRDIAWISMRQRFFGLSGAVETGTGTPDLTLAGLLNGLIEQFDLSELRRQSTAEKVEGLRAHFRSRPCLVVIDNLETLADYRAIMPYVREAAAPSKFLITSRYSLQGEPGVYIQKLDGLAREDTLALVRHEAALQGLHELANATGAELNPIHDVTGGNPLATKLVIGQTHTFPLTQVLSRLQAASARADEELLTFIHADAWNALDAQSRLLLTAMVFTGDGGGRIEQIAAASGVDLGTAANSLHRLASLSLVQVHGGLNERRYALHPLTRIFVAQRAQGAES